MHSAYEARKEKLLSVAREFETEIVLLYSNRTDSRYSVWASGCACRSSHHYLMLEGESLRFIEVSYRAAELRERSLFDVIEISEEDQYGTFFKRTLSKTKRIGIVGNAPAIHFLGLDVELVDITQAIDRLLCHKSADEVEKITSIAQMADKAVTQSWDSLKYDMPVPREVDLKDEILHRLAGSADQFAFPISVVSGNRLKQSTVGAATDAPIVENLPCLIDFGIVVDGLYCDLTRMFWRTATPLSEKYQSLKAALTDSIMEIEVGMPVEKLIANLQEKLRARKLPAETLELADLGHGIGFGLHEAPILGVPAWDSLTLQDGMLLCIEPEIILDGYRLRHEEMVHITQFGAQILAK